jgi:O-antigen/teichoic acid export membrane protein
LAALIVGQFYWKSAVSLAPWLSAAAVVATTRSFYIDTAFQLANRTLVLLLFTVLALAVNVTLDFWLIPSWGVLGAAMGSFFALLSSSVLAAIYIQFVFPLPLPIVETSKVLVSTGVMFFTVQELATWSGPLALACQIAAGALVYATLILGFNVLNARGWVIERLPQLLRSPLPKGR